MPERILRTIDIDAPADLVFAVVLDFDAYPVWNRFTPRITLRTADVAIGAELDLDCQMTDTELLRDEREVILWLDRKQRTMCMGTSRHRGRPGIRSCRFQGCESLGEHRTRFTNYEQFEGLLAPVVYALYRKKLGRAFERYCEDLKARAEAMARGE